MTHEEKAAELLKRCLDALPDRNCASQSQLIHEVREWLNDHIEKQSSGVGKPACVQFLPKGLRVVDVE